MVTAGPPGRLPERLLLAWQDKFWFTDIPGGEQWEIYTVIAGIATFRGEDGERRWDAIQAELDAGCQRRCIRLLYPDLAHDHGSFPAVPR